MRTTIDISGQKFGKWTVISKSNKQAASHNTYWYCECECGIICEISGTDLRMGKSTQCRKCAGTARKEKQLVQPRAPKKKINEVGKQYSKLIVKEFAYQTLGGSVWKCQCECGNIIFARINNLHSGRTQSCGCIKSRGEEKISKLLLTNHINFIKEYSFDNLVGINGGKLRFDFAIFDENQNLIKLIEFQGRQHYVDIPDIWNDVRYHDQLKRDYCQQHNIPLLEIAYTEIENIDINYLLNK